MHQRSSLAVTTGEEGNCHVLATAPSPPSPATHRLFLGSVVYRVALWYPDLVTHIFSVCTPYQPPTKAFVSLDETISRLPQFGYQGHLAGPEVEAAVTTEQQIRQFLNGLYGARTHDRRTLLSPEKGIMLDTLPALGKTVLLTDEVSVVCPSRSLSREWEN